MGHDKPRVVFVSTFPPEPCGIGHITFEISQALAEFRDVSVVGNIPTTTASEVGGVSRVWRKNDLRYPVRIVREVNRVSDGPETIVHVQHHFNLYGGAISLGLFPLLLLLLRLRGYRVVVQAHSVIDPLELSQPDRKQTRSLPPWLVRIGLRVFYRTLAGLTDRIAVCTPSMRRLLEECYALKPDRIWIVPFGWREHAPARVEPGSKTAIGLTGRLIVMFFGFLDPTKGLGDLLESFARVHLEVPESHLVIAGGVSPTMGDAGVEFLQSLHRRLENLRISDAVTFTGYIDELDTARLNQVLSAADVFVLPYTILLSHGGSSALSLVAGFGKPIVASRISRFTDELVDEETGLLVAPGQPEEIAAAITRILKTPTLAIRLGSNLERLASERTWRASALLLDRELYPTLSREAEVHSFLGQNYGTRPRTEFTKKVTDGDAGPGDLR